MSKKVKGRFCVSIFFVAIVSVMLCISSTIKSIKISSYMVDDNIEAITAGDRFNHDYQTCYPIAMQNGFLHYQCHIDTDMHTDSEVYGMVKAGLQLWSLWHKSPKEGTYKCPDNKITCNIIGDYGFCWMNY